MAQCARSVEEEAAEMDSFAPAQIDFSQIDFSLNDFSLNDFSLNDFLLTDFSLNDLCHENFSLEEGGAVDAREGEE